MVDIEQTVSVVLTEAQVRRIDEVATVKRVSRSAVLRWIVDHYFATANGKSEPKPEQGE